jgi:hypothetical protein
MDKESIPLTDIASTARFVVYSEAQQQLISEHPTRAEALASLSPLVRSDPQSDAAIYERDAAWKCILRCPELHRQWLAEAERRLSPRKKKSDN